MALARIDSLTYSYPGAARAAVEDVQLELSAGEAVVVLGPSGGGKSTLLRALSGLVPHFHGGRFSGRVEVCGLDTRRARPAELAGSVATVFQDPEDQVVMSLVENEVAFGLENVAVPARAISARVHEALAAVDAVHLRERRTAELSGGELQRVCLACALALRPRLLLLDEPTSQLDPAAAEVFLDALGQLDATVVLAEQRTARALPFADRVLFVEGGRVLLDAARDEARAWLEEHRPLYVPNRHVHESDAARRGEPEDPVCRLAAVRFSYRPGLPVLDGVDLEIGRGEVVALEGENGSGKTTLAKIAAQLFEPQSGRIALDGSAGYLLQDPGRYLVCERVVDEVALAVGGDAARARAALARVGLEWAAERHPRDLSSGERERLGLAAVAVAEPDLLVLDEPTRGVDPARKAEIARWLFEYAATGRGVLVATHDRTFPAHRRVSLTEEAAVAV